MAFAIVLLVPRFLKDFDSGPLEVRLQFLHDVRHAHWTPLIDDNVTDVCYNTMY